MDFEEVIIPYGRANEHITAWHHPASSKTLIFLVHGHNGRGDSRWIVALANNLQKAGYAVIRHSVLREKAGDHAQLVMTPSEEAEQAHVVLEHFRDEYTHIIAAGHSQGGLPVLRMGLDGLIDGAVFLMSVMDAPLHVEKNLEKLKLTLDELRIKKHQTYESRSADQVFVYTPAFFEDYETWDIHGMLTEWYGPSLFVAAAQDDRVTPDEVEQGFSMANEPKELFVIESDHDFSGSAVTDVTKKMLQWLKENDFHANDGELH